MDSEIRYDFDEVRFLDASSQEMKRSRVIYSSELKNEFLAMMNANFSNENPPLVANLMPNDMEEHMIEVTSLVGVMQLDINSNPTERFDFFSYIENAKVCILRLPKECVKLEFVSSIDGSSQLVEFDAGDFKIDNPGITEKMVIVSISQDEIAGISPLVHQKSFNPHYKLDDKIVMSTKFYNTIALTEIDQDLLFDNKSLTQLGYVIEHMPIYTPEVVSVDNTTIVLR